MLVLQSIDDFDSLAGLDPDTGTISWSSRDATVAESPPAVSGHITKLAGHLLCFYRLEGVLHFRSDDCDIEISAGHHTEHCHTNGHLCTFSLLHNDLPVLRLAYDRPAAAPVLASEPGPKPDEERYDFCLFVHNVLSVPERRARIYTGQPTTHGR